MFAHVNSVLNDPGDHCLSPFSSLVFPALLFIDLTLNLPSFPLVHQLLSVPSSQEFHTRSSGRVLLQPQEYDRWNSRREQMQQLRQKGEGISMLSRWLPVAGIVCGAGISVLSPSPLPAPAAWEDGHLPCRSTPGEGRNRTTAKGLIPSTSKRQHWALWWGVMDKEGREIGGQCCKDLIFPARWVVMTHQSRFMCRESGSDSEQKQKCSSEVYPGMLTPPLTSLTHGIYEAQSQTTHTKLLLPLCSLLSPLVKVLWFPCCSGLIPY